MYSPQLAFLADVTIDAGAHGYTLDRTPKGVRRVGFIAGGAVAGPELTGRLAPGGGDFALVAADDCIHVDFRAMIETDDGALVYLTQTGRIHAPEHVKPDLIDRARWGALDPSTYYFRTTALFEASAPAYARLNRVVALGMGRHGAGQVGYRLFEVL